MMKKLIATGMVFMTIAVNVISQDHLAMLYSNAGMEYGKANAVDNDTNYINGALFQNTINVDPNGTFNLTAPGATTQVAITKYNKLGELIWAFHVGGTTTSEAPHGIACDANNNLLKVLTAEQEMADTGLHLTARTMYIWQAG